MSPSLHELRRQVRAARSELAAAVVACGVLSGEVVRRYHVRTLRDRELLPAGARRDFAQHVEVAEAPWGKSYDLPDPVWQYLGDGWDARARAWTPGGALGARDVGAAAGAAALARHRLQMAELVTDPADQADGVVRWTSLRSQVAALGDLTEALIEATA